MMYSTRRPTEISDAVEVDTKHGKLEYGINVRKGMPTGNNVPLVVEITTKGGSKSVYELSANTRTGDISGKVEYGKRLPPKHEEVIFARLGEYLNQMGLGGTTYRVTIRKP